MEIKKSILPEKVIRKILVKCPPGIEESFNFFPFFISLSEEFSSAEINILCEQNESLAFSFLPFKAKVFERPKDKMTLTQTHHFCANLNDIFNIDLFFDLENSFNSSFIGFNFRAIERIGFVSGWNRYLLTKKMPLEIGMSNERKGLKLIEFYSGKAILDLKISSGRNEGSLVEKIEQLFKEPIPPRFLLVMLDNFQNVSKEIARWTKFFDCFHDQKFIIWSMNDEDLISELFASVDLGHNELFIHRGANPKEIIYLFNKVSGVVLNNVWAEGLVNFFGVNAISFFDNTISRLPKYEFYKLKPQRFLFTQTGTIQYKYLEEQKEYTEMNQVVDHIHFQFKL